jgi:spore germination protein YaaH/lysophospholipase L1-like esterase/uncharacterized protein YjiK
MKLSLFIKTISTLILIEICFLSNTIASQFSLTINAIATSSSNYSSSYTASNAKDGIKGIWDQGEWAAQGSWDKTPTLRLAWATPQTANKIVIYGRPNKFDSIQNARITLSNGYSMDIGEIPSGGAAKEIYFPTAQITWLEFTVIESSAINPGLTEIEIYNESTTNSSNLAKLTSSVTSSSNYSSAYTASNAKDGIKGIWDQGEWAAQGSWDKTPTLRLTWATPQTANKIVIYGRPNKFDSIQNARITLSNGYSMDIGEIPSGGAAKEIYFPTTQITWLEFTVIESSAINPGLTEIEVYNVMSWSSDPSDSDGDLIYDVFDKFPNNASESEDTDNDNIGNNYDSDNDNDGTSDSEDDFPYNASKTHAKHDLLICASMPTTWDYENTWESLVNNIDLIDILNTCWYTMNADGSITCNEENAELIALIIKLAHNNNIAIAPYVNNYNSQSETFDPERVHAIISDTNKIIMHIQNIINEVIDKSYDGINIDYESCYADDRDAFTNFINNLAVALHNEGKFLQVCVHAKTEEPGTWDGAQSQDWQALSEYADYIKVMTYDYSWSTSPPGPIAPVDWIWEVTEFASTSIPQEKLIMGIPFYGYDWIDNSGTGKTWEEIREIINNYNINPGWDSTAKEPFFEYNGNHTVYYEDSESISYKMDIFYASNVKGISIWRLGGEDPSIWGIIKNIFPDPTPTTLVSLCLGDSITHGYPYLLEPEKTYPAKLQTLLNLEYGIDNCKVINYGISGFRADQVLAVMQSLNLLDTDPDVVLLKVGGNDLAQETLPDKSNFLQVVTETVNEVQTIINLVKSHTNTDGNTPKIIVSTFIPVQNYWSTLGLKIYNNTLLSSLTGADSIITYNWDDFYDTKLQQAYSYLMSDECHPNETGYTIMAENWFEAIQNLDFFDNPTSDYEIIGDIDQINFPEPSGIVFHTQRQTLFVIGDGGDICEITTEGELIKEAHIRNADFEGITFNPATGLLYIAIEGEEKIIEVNPDNFAVNREYPINRIFNGKTVLKAGGQGLEAITFVPDQYNSEGGTFYVANQGFDLNNTEDPSAIFEIEIPLTTNPFSTTVNIKKQFSIGVIDLSGLYYNTTNKSIYIISDATDSMHKITRSGIVLKTYTLPGDNQEGITFDNNGYTYIAQDSGGTLKLKWNI